MCGIFGTINYRCSLSDEEVFRGLWHRGPDQQGAEKLGQVSLYHTRLAIQDLSASGKQPMAYHGLVIVFNGEIYNHMELRKQFGLSAASGSDTLTILMMFELMGMKMLDEFDGMFAFMLYDTREARVYFARDRAGKKPLYLYQKGSSYVCASELNILYQAVKPEIDHDTLADYLYLGHHYRKSTPYVNVTALENGHYLEVNLADGTRAEHCWFRMADQYQRKSQYGFEEARHCLDGLLQGAVQRRIVSSDLDVGAFLSGGIDSGLVTAIAAQHTQRLKTFTVKMDGAFDESVLAKLVADRYCTDHTVVEIDFKNLEQDITRILTNHGEPNSDNSIIPSYYVAQAAKKNITVVLNGDGADELFGGYRRYVPFKKIDFFNTGKLMKATARLMTSILPIAHHKQSRYTYIYRMLKFAGCEDLVRIYCSASSDVFVGHESEFIRTPLMKNMSADLEKINGYEMTALKKLLLVDFDSMLFSRLLPKMDIATMAHSLEGRSPFLARELLEFAPSLADDFKINGIQTKFILRDLARKYLPEELIGQPKRGFEVPLSTWVDRELKTIMASYLLAADALYPSIIKKTFVEGLWFRKIKLSDEKRAKMLFCIFSMEVWYKNL
ncbi:WBPS [Pedobacter sp. BAL39]|uniref:asparagine synthase (glutamine-hydrolyzing) n=1 Tax=Pedobacter sp. BAL39 TaxID=391596 RepID=UPI0001559B8F|nr:asparagine synthase (glutamine-hydrolyzing) [Pedobacter sp. BAL39]EDM38340.1 WBPS [Pedobacter sp. BAL39]